MNTTSRPRLLTVSVRWIKLAVVPWVASDGGALTAAHETTQTIPSSAARPTSQRELRPASVPSGNRSRIIGKQKATLSVHGSNATTWSHAGTAECSIDVAAATANPAAEVA